MNEEENKDLETRPEQETGEERTLEADANNGDSQGIDPLDLITDPEQLRGEAKKQRAIAARLAKGDNKDEEAAVVVPPAKVEAPAAPTQGEYLSRKDFEKSNEKKAIRLATTPSDTDDEATQAAKKEVNENWEGVRLYYTPRRGKDTPEDIAEDILDAHAAWKRKKGNKPADAHTETAREITRTPNARPSGSPQPAKVAADTDTETDPRFKQAKKPSDWYKKKD